MSCNPCLETVNICDLGADPSGARDSTAAIQAALVSGKTVLIPDGNFLVSDTLTITTPWQTIRGTSRGSAQITFTFSSSKIGLDIQPSGGVVTDNVIIRDLYLLGDTNVSKLLNIGGPESQILNCRLVNRSEESSVVWLQDEDDDAGIFNFGARIMSNEIYGSLSGGTGGQYGIYLGLYNQCSSICFNTIENHGTCIYLHGATTQLTVDSNILQRCNDAEQAVYLNHSGSANASYEVNFTRNYFEQVQRAFVINEADVENLVISNNYAFRNSSSSKSASAFYVAGNDTYGGSRTIWVENNNVEDYNTLFSLDGNSYASSSLVSTKGNVLIDTDNWATGAYADYAYTTRVANPYFVSKVVSGSGTFSDVARVEAPTCTFRVPIQWDSHEEAEFLKFYYIPVDSGAQVIATLYAIDVSHSSTSPAPVASLPATNTEGLKSMMLPRLGAPHTQYYLEFATSGGTTSYVYPATLYLRQ